MVKENCAVFSCLGLGDGLLSLILSNNLYLNGKNVTTFHPFIGQLQSWFPHLPISTFPSYEEIPSVLGKFDRFYIFKEKTTWMEQVTTYCQMHFPEKTTIINPIATLKNDYPHWEEAQFDGKRCMVDNIHHFCENILRLTFPTKSNGIVVPDFVVRKKYPKRVVLHPMSSREGKNWPKEKYIALSEELKSQGYEPVFILTSQEKRQWEGYSINAPHFPSLCEMAEFIAESGYMVGNDSGIGHLSSCLGLPAVIICRSRINGDFWKPGWAPSVVLTPSPWIPNLKGLRLRDKYWKKWVSVDRVLDNFTNLVQ